MQYRMVVSCLILTISLPYRDWAQNPAAKGSILADLSFEVSPFMQRSAYRNANHIAPESDIAPDGAMSRVNRLWDSTHQGKWYIEEQRYGYDAIAAGLANNDTMAINRGLHIFDWGFQQQQSDGSFNCPDAFHSTSFFVEATAHAVLLLQASTYAFRYKPVTDQLKPKILQAALWMIKPDIEQAGRQRNLPYTHRRYLVAAALGETGILTGNSFLVNHSLDYIREGISLQDKSGFNPEKGGYDCSYHSVGMVYAERYYDIVADGADKKALYAMLQKGIDWLATRVRGWSLQSANSSYGELASKVVNGKAKRNSPAIPGNRPGY